MTLAILLVAAIAVFVVAAVTVGREARRLAVLPPRPVYDVDESVEHVADRLPFEVAAQLSHDDVRTILRWHLDWFRAQGVTPLPDDPDAPGAAPTVVLEEGDAVDVLCDRAAVDGTEYTPDQIEAVVDAHMDYLTAIGAVAPADGAGGEGPDVDLR